MAVSLERVKIGKMPIFELCQAVALQRRGVEQCHLARIGFYLSGIKWHTQNITKKFEVDTPLPQVYRQELLTFPNEKNELFR